MTNEGWEKWKADIRKFFKKRKRGWSYGVGTNEEIDYSSAEDVLNDIKVTDISKDDAETINRLFFTGSACVVYGFFPCFYDYL